MPKYPLIGASLAVTCMIVLASFINVVGYQTIQSSNQKIINDKVDQKELLFQTILDIASDNEIQKILLNSEMRRGIGRFFVPNAGFSVITPHVLTKSYLNYAYIMGVILSRRLDASKIHSLLEQYQVSHQWIQKEINAVIEKDVKLNGEITQLSNSKCDCENNKTTPWTFYILCTLLVPIFFFVAIIWIISHHMIFDNLLTIISDIGYILNC